MPSVYIPRQVFWHKGLSYFITLHSEEQQRFGIHPAMSWQRPTEQVSLDDDVLEQEGPPPDASGLSSNKVAAIIENRAKEIGIAFFDGDEATLHLTQFAGVHAAEPAFLIRGGICKMP